MPENKSKSLTYLLPLGVAFAVSAAFPLSSFTAEAATAPDRLSALRAAASSGELKLLSGDASAPVRLAGTEGFDNGAPADPQPPPPVRPTEPGQ